MKKKHYAWVICACCFWLFINNMGLTSNILTVYLPFIEAEGLSHSMGSAILTVRCLFSLFTSFFVVSFYRRFTLRTGILIASLTGAAAPLVFCLTGAALPYYLGAALAGVAYGAGSVYPVSLLISNWFHKSRGLALGISSAGSAIASMILSPFFSEVILAYGLRRAFLLQAILMLLSAVLIFFLLRNTPAEKGIHPYGAGEGAEEEPLTEEEGEAMSMHMLLVLAVMMLLIGGAGQAFSGHLSVLTIASGYDAGVAARVISVFGLVLFIGKFAAGWISDRIGALSCSALLIGVFILGCFAVMGMNGLQTFWCFAMAAMLGFGAAVYNVGPSLWAADLSSQGQYAKTLRWLQVYYNLGGILFTAIPGIIADRTGEYKSSYFLFAAMMGTSLALLYYAYRRRAATSRVH